MARSRQPPPSRWPQPGSPLVLTVTGPVARRDIPALCSRTAALLADVEPGSELTCDVQHIGTPDSVTLDALARMQLTARRMGHGIRLRNASPALRWLLARTGLSGVLPTMPSRDTSTTGSEG